MPGHANEGWRRGDQRVATPIEGSSRQGSGSSWGLETVPSARLAFGCGSPNSDRLSGLHREASVAGIGPSPRPGGRPRPPQSRPSSPCASGSGHRRGRSRRVHRWRDRRGVEAGVLDFTVASGTGGVSSALSQRGPSGSAGPWRGQDGRLTRRRSRGTRTRRSGTDHPPSSPSTILMVILELRGSARADLDPASKEGLAARKPKHPRRFGDGGLAVP